MAKKCMEYRELRRKYAISGSKPLQTLRTTAWLYASLWTVPHLLPRARSRRPNPWRNEIILVRASSEEET